MNARWTGSCGLLAVLILVVPCLGEMVTRRWGTAPKAPPGLRPADVRAKPPTGYVVRTQTPPVIDGKLTDEVWAKAQTLWLARTLDGFGRAAHATQVKTLRDEKTLYLAIRCFEPLVKNLRASRRSHDGAIWSDDSVEFFLGTRGVYYHLGVNAVGSTYDAQAKDGSWNCGMRAAAGRGEHEWTAEVAIPLAKMAGKGSPPVEWIANFNRNRYVSGNLEEFCWSPTYSPDSHVPARFGRLLFKAPPPEATEKPLRPVIKKKSLVILPCQGGQAVIRFDLSELPANAKIHRAELRIFRTTRLDGQLDEALTDIEIHPLFEEFRPGQEPKPAGEPLQIRGPWYDRLDATEAVQKWASGGTNGGFFVKACPFWNAEATCLDVAYAGRPRDVPKQVADVKAFHRSGQTFITWKEITDPVGADKIKWGPLKLILDDLDRKARLRYCVYRSDQPITAATLAKAERIATVKPLSCWNVNARNIDRPIDEVIATKDVLMTGQWSPFRNASVDGEFGRDCPIDRLAIPAAAGGEKAPARLPRGTGLYVHTAEGKTKAYYAVVTSLDGVENTKDISPANTAGPIAEEVAEPEPVLQAALPKMPVFDYDQQRLHYVRWVGRKYANVPYQYYNWTVAVPNRPAKPMPIELNLHRDGHSFWRTHYRIERDSLVLCPHDFPLQTWWYGYHDAHGTLRSFRQGRVQPYTERRLLWFINWAARKWAADRARVLVTGCAGGASGGGALHLGLRHPEVFSLVISGHGAPVYLDAARRGDRFSIWMGQSMQGLWGKMEWNLQTDTGKSVWTEHDLTKLVDSLPDNAPLPLVTLTSHESDSSARAFYEVMFKHNHAILARFWWGGTRYLPVSRTGTYPNVIRQDVGRDGSLLAFRYARAVELVGRGEMGEFNTQFRWREVVDSPERYEVTLHGDTVTDVAIRRTRKFKLARGKHYAWSNAIPGAKAETQTGEAIASEDGLLVLAGVRTAAAGSRLTVTPK